ncbi:hypothetical protein [Desmospora profundinema]|uniref:Uncharacterized protein n=1 Tax=Desmospora profundinema TaxID=1571184 RepID=A0ABU1IPP1_9BACL|nr:hypothetical protein [Desmospora profundinema]MDR6226368.1 hypothetical protein [Desmospora profundinema]
MVFKAFMKYVSYRNRFAMSLGFKSFDEMSKHTYSIFLIPPDAWCFATRLPDGGWAVWNNQGSPPYNVEKWDTWEEAARYLRIYFDSKGLTEECWQPQGYDEIGKKEFQTKPPADA